MGGSEESTLRQRLRQGRLCVTYSGSVYDVTDFADRHPGGKEWLKKYCGEDVTEVMRCATPHRHSSAAYSILAKYRVVARDSVAAAEGSEGRARDDCHVRTLSSAKLPIG
ncbi:hypothetical protein ACOMHN_032843 [Nucella lapillus]